MERGLPPPPPGPITHWIGFTLIRSAHRARECVEAALEPLGFRGRHHAVLLVLQSEGALSQVALTRRLWFDRTTMVSIIDDLESLGLVKRTPDPQDRRAHAVLLTTEGETLLARANEVLKEAEAEFLRPLSEEEQQQFRALLRRLIADTNHQQS